MDSLAIYVHWPYCARICPYCDFNIYKQRADSGLVEALAQDIATQAKRIGPRQLRSIHFGGGTPSLLGAGEIDRILSAIKEHFDIGPDCEIAIEANPQDADQEKWQAYASLGVSRLSLGAQSFHDPALKLLGRDHSAAQAKDALALAADIFASVSVDLIFGWAGQDQDLLGKDLDVCLSSGVNHVSAYQLTIEEGTAFAKAEARGDIKAVGPEQSAGFYDLIRARLTGAGYEHYEVSNYAKAGHHSRHNLTYWEGGDYLGVGPGAHGRLTLDGKRYATIATLHPAAYKKQHLLEETPLTPTEWAEEYLLMGLRIETGISMARFESLGGRPLDMGVIGNFTEDGLMRVSGDQLRASPKGRLVLNTLTEKLLIQ